jgi:hypothetical protein
VKVAGILTGSSYGRIGDGVPVVRAWMIYRLVELEVTEAELRRMAELARAGTLFGQAARKASGKLATDMRLLAAPESDPTVLVSWLNDVRASLREEQLVRERAERERQQRQRDLTPKPPPSPQGSLGLPANATEPTSNAVALVAPATPVVPRLSGLSFGPQRAAPATAPPAAAVGDDKPP